MTTRKEYREENGIIYFDLTSDGTTGKEWITRLGKWPYHVSWTAGAILESHDFKPTSGETTTIAIVKERFLRDESMPFQGHEQILEKTSVLAHERQFIAPNAEIGCLMRETFYDWELGHMGLEFVMIMHEPVHFMNHKNRLLPGSDHVLSVGVLGGKQWDHGEYVGYHPVLRTFELAPGNTYFKDTYGLAMGYAFVQAK